MKKNKKVVKSKDTEIYEEVEFDVEKSQKERDQRFNRKRPTSVALDEDTINLLKKKAIEKGIPYQVLMRSYILRGLREDKF